MENSINNRIDFITSNDNDEVCVMNSKNDNMEIMINDKADEVIAKLFQLLLSTWQIGLETSVRGRDFIFDCFYLSYYKCHKMNFKIGGSYVDSPDWMKNKTAKINPLNKNNNKCLQYAVTVVLNHEQILQRKLVKNKKN